ncbi:MAG: phosphomannomutase [Nitrospirales bacterium]|nr:phosphomannomutase [Nitrospirales bacterium]
MASTDTFRDAASCWQVILSDVEKNRGLLSEIERFARENTAPSPVVFGTSGWRGEIGTDYTFNNVRIVTEALIGMFKSGDSAVIREIGAGDFDEIRRRGIIVGHDNRFLGRAFAMEVIGRLQRAGIRTWYAGEATTPEFSAGIEMTGAACSINLTPSHNPANYAGFKFNPADGGPAGTWITSKIEEIANRMMGESLVLEPIIPEGGPGSVEGIDLLQLYLHFIRERGTVDLDRVREFIDREDCLVCVDTVHGATRGRVERLVGVSGKIVYLRTADDYLFGGRAPEPSEKNMEGVENVLRSSSARFKLGVIMDPDGDRIRYSDGTMQIPMNYFGAMALHFLHEYKKIPGVAAKSVGTSNFVNAIAEKRGVPVRETRVGFKNFRPYLLRTSPERAIIAFEESDGISGYNNTLEKDALFGFLLAVEMMAVTGKSLSAYLHSLMEEYGHYYPDRSGIAVDRSLVGEPLVKRLSVIREQYPKGTVTEIGGRKRTVKDLITVDGTKVVFDDGSWLMIRPSGTEPKVRFYIEARTEEGKKEIFEAAERITREALR